MTIKLSEQSFSELLEKLKKVKYTPVYVKNRGETRYILLGEVIIESLKKYAPTDPD